MGKSPSILPVIRSKIVSMFNDAKLSQVVIARRLNISRHAVQNALNKHKQFDSFTDLPRSGRPSKLSTRDLRDLKRCSLKNRRLTAPDLQGELSIGGGPSVSRRTIGRHLCHMGLYGRIAVKKPFVSEVNRKKRIDFARNFAHWTFLDWSKVLFSDESKFDYFTSKSRIFVRRRLGEKYNVDCMAGTVKHGGGGSVLVWGSFGAHGVGDLVFVPSSPKFTAASYIDLIDEHLVPSLMTSLENPSEEFFFQQDNDPKHKAKITMSYFVNNGVPLLPWPPQSPDLNPIENIWRIMKEELRKNDFRAHSRDEMIQKLKDVWSSIPKEKCVGLINSMPIRLEALIKAKGYPISF